MSSPIRGGSPNNPDYYAPRRSGSDAKNVFADPPSSSADSATADSWTTRSEDAEVIVPFPRAREYLNEFEHRARSTWRTKVLVASGIAVAVLMGGIVYFGFVGTAPQVGERRPSPEPELSLATRLQTAAVDIQKAAQQVVTPTLVVNESAGDMSAPLALGLEVKNYTPGTVVALSGFPAGTSISKGAGEAGGRWRVSVGDLAGAKVTPPGGYSGVMTITAELRTGNDLPIVRSPVRLTWNARPAPAPAPAPPLASTPTPAPAPAPVASPASGQAAPKTTMPPARQLDPKEAAALLRRAEELKAAGDIAAARLLLQRVAEANNVQAAFELAETYDPVAMKKFGASSVAADPALAQYWYQRARDGKLPGTAQEPEAIASRTTAGSN
jgi:hypothetical protein